MSASGDPGDILFKSIPEIQEVTGKCWSEAEEYKKEVAKSLFSAQPVPVFELLAKDPLFEERLTTNDSCLDNFLRGGLPVKGIVEISGEAGSGKTQLCLQLCITAQWLIKHGGLESGVVYLSTEGRFPLERLTQLIESCKLEFQNDESRNAILYADRVHVVHIPDVDKLQSCIDTEVADILRNGKARCIIIDSVGAVFRSQFETGEIVERAQALQNMALKLRTLQYQYKTAVICVNQVTDVINDSREREVMPCLGLAWSNLVTTRIMLARTEDFIKDFQGINHRVRTMRVVFSPSLPPSIQNFIVTDSGMSGI